MNRPRKLKTKKLFYGEWPYKVATLCQGASILRHETIASTIIDRLNGPERHRLSKFCENYKKFSKKEHKIRIERNHVNFFIKDRTLYDEVVDLMKDYITEVSEPENDLVLDTLNNDKKVTVVNELPHGKYTTKIVLKSVMPVNQRTNLVELLQKYGIDKVRMSKTTERYLNGVRGYMQDPFFYIEDEKMMTLLLLAANGYIRKTERFVLKSSINTES